MLYTIGKPLTFLFYKLFFRASVTGNKNIPKDGAVLLCVNHLSNHDPLLLGTFTKRRIHFMAKEELFRMPIIRQMVRSLGAFPVDRNNPGQASFKAGMEILSAGKVLSVFPQGRRFAEIRKEDAKPGVSLFALKSDAVVIPVKIAPQYKIFRKTRIIIGKPIDLSAHRTDKPKSDTLKAVTDLIMEKIMEL
ncbi:MAG: 1-acyl-sn-glycerol-3-phosphate acyltransferase [Defluviitaleaceae bacterium]|nr:1-acyl-sn-glycerol-3-phosphate acyltransferase [Defluviitaleaceae bacterium]